MEITKTERGFDIAEFTDLYGNQCSLQKSSLATEDAIWLGFNNSNPSIMVHDAKRLGIETNEKNGWIPFPIPKEVSINTRMHLSQEMVKELLPALIQFAETGSLTPPKSENTKESEPIEDAIFVKGTLKYDLKSFNSSKWIFTEVGVLKTRHLVTIKQFKELNERVLKIPDYEHKVFTAKLKTVFIGEDMSVYVAEVILDDSISE